MSAAHGEIAFFLRSSVWLMIYPQWLSPVLAAALFYTVKFGMSLTFVPINRHNLKRILCRAASI
jgi:hypothetical protein